MNHLLRELAPVSDEAWSLIDDEARRSLKHPLAGRRLVDMNGPLGWDASSVDLGRVRGLSVGPVDGIEASVRTVAPLVELRAPFTLLRSELDAAERGATDLDLSAVIGASRAAAIGEDSAIFHGYEAGGIVGIIPSSPHKPVVIDDKYAEYPEKVAKAVALLRGADIAGPYSIAMGARSFTGVTETTEHGGYPVFDHLRNILGGEIVWAPAVDGAVVLSQRGGDFELSVGQDFSIGYLGSDETSVRFQIEESLTFRVITPEAAVHLRYA